jgi:hypothetical protein
MLMTLILTANVSLTLKLSHSAYCLQGFCHRRRKARPSQAFKAESPREAGHKERNIGELKRAVRYLGGGRGCREATGAHTRKTRERSELRRLNNKAV